MTRVINAREALDALSAEMRRRGADYRYLDHYKSCTYVEWLTDEPACIAGGALITTLGLDLIDATGAFRGRTVSEIEAANHVRFTKAAIAVIRVAQAAQDSGATHGQAVDVAMALCYQANELGLRDYIGRKSKV